MRPHNPSDPMLATGVARFAQIEKDPWGSIDPMARRIGRANQAEQPLILHRSIGEGFPQPGIEPATRYVEQPAHDSRIKLLPMGFDEDVLQSDIRRSALFPHRPSQVSTSTKGVRESLGSPTRPHIHSHFRVTRVEFRSALASVPMKIT